MVGMMQDLEKFIDRILSDALVEARSADKPVGYIGLDLPLDIQHASSRLFCHLPWSKSKKTPKADKWLESSFPGWTRSILEDWIEGNFNIFDQVVFTRGDDAIQRLYYYICELQTQGIIAGPEPIIFDVATISRQISVRHCMNAINKLLEKLELTQQDLGAGIDRANDYRNLYVNLDRKRLAPGHIHENVARADLFCDLLPYIENLELPACVDKHRLLLAGSVPPDDSFYLAVEEVGWNIVGELHQRSLLRYGMPVESNYSDAVAVVASHINDSGYGPRAFGDRSFRLLEEVSRTQAEAVVLWLSEDDEALAWHVAQQCKVLEAERIPALIMTRRRWDGSDNAAAQILKFVKELEA
jgi:hypothetical protein